LSTMAIFRHFEKYTIKNASHITVDSRYIGEIISPLTTAKIHRIPNCVHSDFFNHSKVDYDSKTDGRLTIAFFGQLRREKGLEILMDALPLIREKIHEVVLKVIGNTTELSMSKIVNRSRYLGVANNVAFLGWMEWDQIIQELRNTDLVVTPSIYEPFGCTVVEGMAMGLPVLGSRTGGIKENIVDGETGVLFEVGNSKDLAEKAIWLLKEDGLRKKIGIKAAEYAKRAFHPDVVAAQHLRLYQSICSSMN